MSDAATGPLRTAFTFGPHAGAHRVAARAGISVFVPLGVLVLIDHRAAVVAVAGQLVSSAFRWHPPGSIFLVFGITVCASIPGKAHLVPVAAAVTMLSAGFAMLVGRIGALREPAHRPRAVVPSADLGATLRDPLQRGTVARLLAGILLAGTVATSFGGPHPSWAMVAVVATLTGPRRHTQVIRGVHRVVGTLVGVFVAWPLLETHPTPIVMVVLIMVLQMAAELLVGRNYAVALLAITPLALLMGQLSAPRPIGTVLTDRAVETALGALIALALLIPRRRPSPGSAGRRDR